MNMRKINVENMSIICGNSVVFHMDTEHILIFPGCFMVTIIFTKRSIVVAEGEKRVNNPWINPQA